MIYSERQNLADTIIKKMKDGTPLTAEEQKYVEDVLTDPLQEFCMREGTFRLVEILNVDVEKAASLEDESSQIIRDDIDYNDNLYDEFDDDLRDLLDKEEGES